MLQELVDQRLQPDADFVGREIAELLPERAHRHDRFCHRPMAAGAADAGEKAADELAGVLRISEIPDRDDH